MAEHLKKEQQRKPVTTPLGPFGRCSDVSSRYEKLGRIGEGTYGVVYRAKDKITGGVVALKRCLPHHEASDGFPLTTLREIMTLRELSVYKHSGIVQLLDVAVSKSRSGVFLVFEYCEHDMAELLDTYYNIHAKSPFREGQVKRLAIQLLHALSFLHSRNLLHRDIKMSNLLYNHRGELRLADFGLARRACLTDPLCKDDDDDWKPPPSLVSLTPKVVSLWYRPPEILLGSDVYDQGVDNWGAGCVIAELLSGVPLMKGTDETDQIFKMFKLLGPPTLAQWPDLNKMPLVQKGALQIPAFTSSSSISLLDKFDTLSPSGLCLLSNLLKYDYKKRLKAEDALKSPYFIEMPTPTDPCLMPTFPSRHR